MASYKSFLLGGRNFLETFSADGGTGGGSGDGGTGGTEGGEGGTGTEGGSSTNTSNFDDQLKNDPAFKDWYTKKFGSDFSNRTKKLRDDQGNLIDADEYWKLKAEQDKKKKEEETETERLQRERDEALSKVANVAKAEKRIAVKEHAMDQGYNPKLVARLMETELDSIKFNDGKYEGIAEAIDKLAEEFPQIKAQAGNDDQSGGEGNKGSGTYNAGDSRQRQNQSTPPNKYNKGAERAKARHAKQS
jgi:hypothetical protein